MNLVHADPECDLDYVPGSARPVTTLNAAMSNSFAFGGTNVSLVCRAVV
jgi:3-oxoacyl-(acyl-carrier-protein) synthase